jgi:hypothetical protein
MQKEAWNENKWLVVQGYQRHLFQVGFVDKLIGHFISRLKSLDLYNKSLIVITADHGVNFMPGTLRRAVLRERPSDMMSVPLIIKPPYNKGKGISDRNVETIDILPTIADILGFSLPWPVDGHSAIDEFEPERSEKIIYNLHHEKFVFPPALDDKYISLERKLALFGSGKTKPQGLFQFGPYGGLIGKRADEFRTRKDLNIKAKLEQVSYFAQVNQRSFFIPSQINGNVLLENKSQVPLNLTITVNDTIQAVTQTFRSGNSETRFTAIVPELSFKSGSNRIEVFVISERDGQIELVRTDNKSIAANSFASIETIFASEEGRSVPVVPNSLNGFLDFADITGDYFTVRGWAADIKNSQVPETIVIYINGKFFYAGQCNESRPDVSQAYGISALHMSGFKYIFPLRMFKSIDDIKIRIFAISKNGFAYELKYPK